LILQGKYRRGRLGDPGPACFRRYDVLAGWAVGTRSGWYAHSRDVPIAIELLPHGVAVGLRTQF